MYSYFPHLCVRVRVCARVCVRVCACMHMHVCIRVGQYFNILPISQYWGTYEIIDVVDIFNNITYAIYLQTITTLCSVVL